MKRYLYVEARNVADSGAPVMVSFDSVVIVAENEDSAYAEGQRAILRQRAAQLTEDDWSHSAGAFLNDYVREIGPFEAMQGQGQSFKV